MCQRKLEAAVFDLDGVITRTAKVHARAWKQSFDTFLLDLSARTGGSQAPFDEVVDYLDHVDGKPRRDGVRDFLRSRNIQPDAAVVEQIAKDKNRRYRRIVDEEGVEVFDSSVTLIRALRDYGVPTAVASSSRNCERILEAAKLTLLFDARVDGNDLSELDLPGKPAPDLFLEAARRIGADPRRSVVFEDARSGVKAGVRAGYGIVIGVARASNEQELLEAGAHRVVRDLSEIDPDDLVRYHFETLEN